MTMGDVLNFIMIILGSYLLGSIPFGFILTKAFTGEDIRKVGSGNIGATNVLRTGHKKLALATLFLDMLKAIVPVILGHIFLAKWAALAGVVAVAGHIFPVWLHYKGGKGVATGMGMFFALYFPIGFSMAIIWLAVAYRTRYSSLAAITAYVAAPLVALFSGSIILTVCSVVVSGMVIYKHRDNLERLRQGTESKISLNWAKTV